jgi:hypothetical protein
MFFGDKRGQMLCLEANGILDLVAGNNKSALGRVDRVSRGYNILLNDAMIRQMVDAATTADPRYTPSDVKREKRKLDTQARYELWQKAYRELKKGTPTCLMSGSRERSLKWILLMA